MEQRSNGTKKGDIAKSWFFTVLIYQFLCSLQEVVPIIWLLWILPEILNTTQNERSMLSFLFFFKNGGMFFTLLLALNNKA